MKKLTRQEKHEQCMREIRVNIRNDHTFFDRCLVPIKTCIY